MGHHKTTRRQAGGLNSPVQQGFHLMAKPTGPACNLHCTYCFYCEKKALLPENRPTRMSEEVLEAYTRDYIRSQPGSSVIFEEGFKKFYHYVNPSMKRMVDFIHRGIPVYKIMEATSILT